MLRVRNDVFYFLEEYCWTLDEDAEKGEDPIKRFPTREERPDLYKMAELWLNEKEIDEQRTLGIDKSRQMMGTWTLILCNLWLVAFHHGKRVFFQSKKEDDAIALLDRAWITFRKLPRWLKPTHQKKEAKLLFPNINSEIWAIPQGGDHIRSYTVSSVFSDEAAKQPEFGDAYTASIPSVGKRGRFTFLSTPRGKGNAFYRLMKEARPKDKPQDDYGPLKPKITIRDMTIVSLPFQLNPKYQDPEWEKAMRAKLGDDKFNQEYGLSYETEAGKPVIRVDPKIHFRPLQYIDGKPLWRGWDFGYRRPACIVTQMNLKDQWCWLWGLIGRDETIKRFAARVLEACDALFPPGIDDKGKRVPQLWLDYCDPAGTQVSDKAETTSIEHLANVYEKRYSTPEEVKRISLSWRKWSFQDGITAIRNRFELRPDQQPGVLINEDFDDAKDALLGGYHFPDDRRSGAVNELPADDGYYIHLMDAMRYIANYEFYDDERDNEEDKNWPKPWEEIANRGGLVLVR